MLLGAQYTFVEQKQTALRSPYQGRLSLRPGGDRQTTHTIGLYTGWAPVSWGQIYFDAEKFMGAAVSGATGLGALTNGDVVREGTGLKKQFYIARLYARFMLPFGSATAPVARAQDQIPGTEGAQRLELKVGRLSVSDDLDKNRYAGATRTEFMSSSLWQNTAWDYAANTRGYTDGFVLAYISPVWSLKYAMFRMPLYANGQTLETLARARGENLELTLTPQAVSTIVRLGWNDGKTDFAFTEVDRVASFGGQLSGAHWQRAPASVRAQLGPDFQYIQNPGFNRDRCPVRFYSVRLRLEY
jgi:high affinity Mn2+ porin